MNRTPDKLLNVSLVIYKHRPEDVLPLLKELAASVFVKNICIVDNSPTPTPEFKGEKITYFFTGKNPGYGAGHNIAIRKTIKQEVPYHLVINPDIEIAAEVPEMLIHFAEKNPDIGHIMPRVVYPNGEIQYLCKLLPTLSILFSGGFFLNHGLKNALQNLNCGIRATTNSWKCLIFRVVLCFQDRRIG
jgi:GT2 family glycosyltransferase